VFSKLTIIVFIEQSAGKVKIEMAAAVASG